MRFKLIKGESASKGIDAIFRGPTRLECASMAAAINFRALREVIGQPEFDNRFGEEGCTEGGCTNANLIISKEEGQLYPYIKVKRVEEEKDVRKGDAVYFRNYYKYRYKHPGGYFKGENAFCMGKNLLGINTYRGWGVKKKTARQMRRLLKKAYNADRSDKERNILGNAINEFLEKAKLKHAFEKTPTNDELDKWIKANPRTFVIMGGMKENLDEYHTEKFPKKIKLRDVKRTNLVTRLEAK
jgi:preprotein translocase subunit Sss1